jgi:hypothetical protein
MLANELIEMITIHLLEINDYISMRSFSLASRTFRNIILALIRKKDNKYTSIAKYHSSTTYECIYCYEKCYSMFFDSCFCVCRKCSFENCLEITKTKAKKEYKLSDIDLQEVHYRNFESSYRRNAIGTLYYERDIISLAIKVHGSLEKLKEKQDLSLERANKIMDNKYKKYERKNELINILSNQFNKTKENLKLVEYDELFLKYVNSGVPTQEKKKQELYDYLNNKIDSINLRIKEKNVAKERKIKVFTPFWIKLIKENNIVLSIQDVISNPYIINIPIKDEKSIIKEMKIIEWNNNRIR